MGLSLALELGLQGRRCLLVERHDRVGFAPRAKTTNVRSRELMRRWDIAQRLAAASPFGVDYPSNIVFATRLAGRELARFANAFYCAPVRDERFAEHAQWIPQYKVEDVLRARAAEFPGVALRFATELVDWTETPGGIDARLADLATGERIDVRAAYLVGADGARSTVREKLGIRMEGRSPLSHHHNIVFRSPGLAQRHALGPAVMYWLVNADVPAVVAPLDLRRPLDIRLSEAHARRRESRRDDSRGARAGRGHRNPVARRLDGAPARRRALSLRAACSSRAMRATCTRPSAATA